MALNTGKILMRRGQEVNFDPNKMTPGEWAISLDSKFVRMCFQPGVCVRMATYDAFEADMVQIQAILAECKTIEEAVTRINDEIFTKAQAVAEYTTQAKQYRDEAEQFRNQSFSTTPEGYLALVEQVEENTRKIKDGGTTDYEELENKPKINNVELSGNKTANDLGLLHPDGSVSFSEASTRKNIAETDSVKNIFGKIKKFFADLKPHAFSNPTNNLLATEPGTPLDAVQGKVLNDKVDAKLSLAGESAIIYGSVSGGNASSNLIKLNVSGDDTVEEVFNKIKNITIAKLIIKTNSNSSNFNKSLPVTTGGIIEIINVDTNGRGCIEFYNYRTGDRYTKYSSDGTFGNWEKLVTETALNSSLANVMKGIGRQSWSTQIKIKTTTTSGGLALVVTSRGMIVLVTSSSTITYFNYKHDSTSSTTQAEHLVELDSTNKMICTIKLDANSNFVSSLIPIIGSWEIVTA